MPAGFQVFDAQGVLICDITDRLPKVKQTGVISGLSAPNSRTIVVPGLVRDGSWVVVTTQQTINVLSNGSFTCTRVDQRGLPNTEYSDIYYTVYQQ